MKFWIRSSLFMLLALSSGACGDEGSGDDDDNDSEMTLEEQCDATCHKAEECIDPVEFESWGLQGCISECTGGNIEEVYGCLRECDVDEPCEDWLACEAVCAEADLNEAVSSSTHPPA